MSGLKRARAESPDQFPFFDDDDSEYDRVLSLTSTSCSSGPSSAPATAFASAPATAAAPAFAPVVPASAIKPASTAATVTFAPEPLSLFDEIWMNVAIRYHPKKKHFVCSTCKSGAPTKSFPTEEHLVQWIYDSYGVNWESFLKREKKNRY